MSRAFDRFQSDLRAAGPEKKDGFDLASLQRLAGTERVEAIALLQRALEAGDETAVPALLALDPIAGASFLRSLLNSADEMVRVRIVAALLAAGRDPDAEQALPALLQARLGVVRQQAIQATRHLWSARARLDLLPKVLQAEPDAMNRMFAASELLHALGRASGDQRAPDFRDSLDGLRSADATVRERTLALLGLET